jgi:uncharacterized protein YndB with AHSA1/START domain
MERTMTDIADSVELDAPPADVWQAIADPARHAAWHPFVTAIDGSHQPGAARICDVSVGNKRGRTEERCLRRDEGEQIVWRIDGDTTGFSKMVADWQSGFRLAGRPDGETTTVTAFSSFAPAKPLVRLLLPLVRRRFHRAQQTILAGLKRDVESTAPVTGRAD